MGKCVSAWVVEEAIALILQSASMAEGGETFILKMGTPVRIIDMAKNLVLLHGLEPGKDIEIKVTGLKQGEKMDEELVEDSSHLIKSLHPDIMTLQSESIDLAEMKKRVLDLEILSRGADTQAMLRKLQELVPTFTPSAVHLGAGDA
ncbi:MAG: polysaccharide biosynthesis protein [Elusimicrobiota bacterium]